MRLKWVPMFLFSGIRTASPVPLVCALILTVAWQIVAGQSAQPAKVDSKNEAAPVSALDSRRIDSLFAAAEAATEAANEATGPAASENQATATGAGVPNAEGDMHPAGAEHTVSAGSVLPLPGPHPPSSLAKIKLLESVPVLHEGRLKPMITFARHVLLQFSGRTQYEKFSAMQIMSQILLAPEATGDYRIFLINNPEVVQALGIAPEKHRRYTFRQLEKALPKLEKLAEKANATADDKRDLVQKEVLRIFRNVVEFINLSRTFSFALPSAAFTVQLPETKERLGLKKDQTAFSFWDLMSSAQAIAQVLEGVGNRNPEQRTNMELEIISLSQSMYYSSQALHASPFCILPAPAAGPEGGNTWLSPSELLGKPDQLQNFHREFTDWSRAVSGYRSGNQKDFDEGIQDYLTSMENRAYEHLSQTRFPLEILYQKGEPFFWSLVAYWLALLGTFGFFLLRSRRWLYQASVYVFLAGFIVHVAAIVSRVLIMHRPPVTSLYETFPFVAAVAILAALFIERLNYKRASVGIGILCAALLGIILLSIANRYAAEGDTMQMLVAVLNSNFWLSTHVVTVTIGYSACLLAGAIGHIWLIRALLPGGPTKPERLKEIAKMIYGTLCFGLLFSFIGTVLGGIWADQSWGRFWGWDPKENGALLIVVWCIILLHAKQWGKIGNAGMAQGAIFGGIVVSLAWFGVNLLNVGLHSYGFTDGAANKLYLFIGGEMLFMLLAGTGQAWVNSTKEPR